VRNLTAHIFLGAMDTEVGVRLCSLRNHTYTESGHCRDPTGQWASVLFLLTSLLRNRLRHFQYFDYFQEARQPGASTSAGSIF